MARPRVEGLTPRETGIMQVIWRHGEVGVETIQAELPDRLVDSTIRTLLQIMENKGYVKSHKEGRARVYQPLIQEDQVQKSALKQMINRLFGGSSEALLARLVEDEHVDLEELDRLRKRLREKNR